MISYKTIIELVDVIDNYDDKFLNRLYAVFEIEHVVHPIYGKFSKAEKIDTLLKILRRPPEKGPFTDSFILDMIDYLVNHYYRYEDEPIAKSSMFYIDKEHIPYDERFAASHPVFTNSLKRDGYVIKGRIIKKMLPKEIEEAKTESEVYALLRTFGFNTAKGHLDQAIDNHSQGNWSAANGQFRSFFEGLLIDISNHIVQGTNPSGANAAIKFLARDVTPPFFREDLNEVEHSNCKQPFINGLLKRLHPQGPHPGLSDEEDCTSRYHILISVTLSLLKRLANRNP